MHRNLWRVSWWLLSGKVRWCCDLASNVLVFCRYTTISVNGHKISLFVALKLREWCKTRKLRNIIYAILLQRLARSTFAPISWIRGWGIVLKDWLVECIRISPINSWAIKWILWNLNSKTAVNAYLVALFCLLWRSNDRVGETLGKSRMLQNGANYGFICNIKGLSFDENGGPFLVGGVLTFCAINTTWNG